MIVHHPLETIYVIGFWIVCIGTWIENAGSYYVCGDPPSGIFAGMIWPLVAVGLLAYWIIRSFRTALASKG